MTQGIPKLIAAFAAAAAVAVGLAACGGDDETTPQLPPPSLAQWQGRVNAFCSDGIQEAIALPLPQTTEALGPDAQARAEILTTVRDAVLPLPQPPDQAGEIDAWLAEIDADVKQLQQVAKAVVKGEDPLDLVGALDESAGQAALPLGLDQCAALSNTIARTP